MKKKIIFACMLLVFACMLCIGVMAQEATTYYLYDDGTALPEGENNISVSELYQQSETELGLFANLKDGDNIVIELQESISYTPTYGTMNNKPNESNCLKISAAATVTVRFNGYSWWFTRDDAYDAFAVYNEGATLNLIGTKAKNPDGTIKELGTNYKGSEINENIDTYSDFVIVYVAGGKLRCENLAAFCTEETIYQKESYLSGKAEVELVDCSILTNSSNMYTISLAGKGSSENNLRIDGGWYGSTCAHNLLDNSYIKNATVKLTATSTGNALILDSWKDRNIYNFPIEDSTIDGRYWGEGDANIIVGENSSFGAIYLKGDGTGGAYVELIDSTYASVDFAGKDGQLTVMTSQTCETAGTKTVYTNGGSTIDEQYSTQNPALGHEIDIENATGVVWENYFENGMYQGFCARCKVDTNEQEGTAKPLFENKGLSHAEYQDTTKSMTQGFKVNTEMLVYLENGYDFGIIATVNKDGGEIAPALDGTGVVSASFVKAGYSIFHVKVTNIPEASKDTKIVFCAYLVNGDKTYYLNNGTTAETVVGLDYTTVSK